MTVTRWKEARVKEGGGGSRADADLYVGINIEVCLSAAASYSKASGCLVEDERQSTFHARPTQAVQPCAI
jgi:hypothetical protein